MRILVWLEYIYIYIYIKLPDDRTLREIPSSRECLKLLTFITCSTDFGIEQFILLYTI